jgi:predicted dehydrogenase
LLTQDAPLVRNERQGRERPFRLALVGAGLITEGGHLPAALACPEIEVAAIVDPVTERAAALATRYGIAPIIGSDTDAIVGHVDGAVIATPNHTHRELALRCLSAGISVLIEKPLANSFAAGLEIVEAAEKAGQILAVGYCSRFRPNIELLKELLDGAYFGTVKRFVHQFGTAGGWAPLSAYNLDRVSTGGGVLMVTGTHFLDRMLHFWGFPDHADLADDGVSGPEANCTATFNFSSRRDGLSGIARYSKTARLPAGLAIETDRGVVTVADRDDAEVHFREHRFPNVEQTLRRPGIRPDVDVFRLQIRDFVGACRSRSAPRVDGRQGLESLRLIEALYANRRPLDETSHETPQETSS